MKKYLVTCTGMLCLLCTLTVQSQSLKPVVPASDVLKDMNSLLVYNSGYLQFNGDFLAYDTQGHGITKDQLLKQTAAGDYLPLRVYSRSNQYAYQLYKLSAKTNDDVRVMLKQIGYTDYGIFQTVGKPMPSFHYIDLNGHVYTSANTKGKIMVLKAWSISCVPCVNEFPELNELVEKYKDRKDIIFVSIAYDSKQRLQPFMKKHPFNYSVVPVSIAYIQDTLKAAGYPAHWVINKQGVVVSMSYDKSEMMAALDKEALKK